MKRTILLVLVIAAAGGLAVWFGNSQSEKRQAREAAQLKAQLEDISRAAAEEREARERAEHQLREIAKASDEVMSHSIAREAALAKAVEAGRSSEGEDGPGGSGDFGKLFSSMFKDPDMKKMIAGQQRMMIDQLYGPLFKKLNLSPEESQAFRDLLAEHMGKATEMASVMFGKATPEERKEVTAKMAADNQAMEQTMKELLGPERYAQYQEYQQTAGERMQLSMFRQELLGSGAPVSDAQFENLLHLMGEEKKQLSAAAGLDFPDGTKGQMPTMDEEQMDKILRLQEQVNQNVLSRASGVLSEPQLEAFGRHQSNQLQMVRFGLSMARKFMGSQ
jgi:hypothetical protein